MADVTDADGEDVRLVLLRNPWGNFEWSGAWGDDSELWTDDIKKQVGYSNEEGLFWMCLDDVCHYFSRIQICHVDDDYQYSFMRSTHLPGSYSLIRLVVTGDGEHTISVAQTDDRCFKRDSPYDYSNCRMIIVQIVEDGDSLEKMKLRYVRGISDWDRDTHCQIDDLPKGNYYVYSELDWPEGAKHFDYCVTCYGASKSYFLTDEKSLFSKEDFLRTVLSDKALQQPEGILVTDMSLKGAPAIKKYKGFTDEGYGFVYIVNEEE